MPPTIATAPAFCQGNPLSITGGGGWVSLVGGGGTVRTVPVGGAGAVSCARAGKENARPSASPAACCLIRRIETVFKAPWLTRKVRLLPTKVRRRPVPQIGPARRPDPTTADPTHAGCPPSG